MTGRSGSGSTSLPLHTVEVDHRIRLKPAYAIVYACAISCLVYHRFFHLLNPPDFLSFSLFLAMLIAELVLAFGWVLAQALKFRPVRRQTFPENLAGKFHQKDFPCIDVFICTADPLKEPPISVVNTALSAMAFDYPAEKLSFYVSDDGGSELTLFAFMEAAKFAKHWLPFCKEYEIESRCPQVYFSGNFSSCPDRERERMKMMYKEMEEKIETVMKRGYVTSEEIVNEEEREAFKRWTYGFTRHHHPTIIQLRVSAVMSNAPIVMNLDCDMYVNDPQTPLLALCFILDPTNDQELGLVQFAQRFYGINRSDIYYSSSKRELDIYLAGMDGLRGPFYIGSGGFFFRKVFFGSPSHQVLDYSDENCTIIKDSIRSETILREAYRVAGCSYEQCSNWGSKIGVRYGTLVEDYFTGYCLYQQGWRTVYCNPRKAAFLGNIPVNLNDALNQNKRWAMGFLQVGFSRQCPLTLGTSTVSALMGMCYANFAFLGINAIPITIYAILPQLTLANGISMFPKWCY